MLIDPRIGCLSSGRPRLVRLVDLPSLGLGRLAAGDGADGGLVAGGRVVWPRVRRPSAVRFVGCCCLRPCRCWFGRRLLCGVASSSEPVGRCGAWLAAGDRANIGLIVGSLLGGLRVGFRWLCGVVLVSGRDRAGVGLVVGRRVWYGCRVDIRWLVFGWLAVGNRAGVGVVADVLWCVAFRLPVGCAVFDWCRPAAEPCWFGCRPGWCGRLYRVASCCAAGSGWSWVVFVGGADRDRVGSVGC
jgi:hypothetical protein